MPTTNWTLTDGGILSITWSGTDGDANDFVEALNDGFGANDPAELTALQVDWTPGVGSDPEAFTITPSAGELLDPNFVEFRYDVLGDAIILLKVFDTAGDLAVIYPDDFLGCILPEDVAVIGLQQGAPENTVSQCYEIEAGPPVTAVGFRSLMGFWVGGGGVTAEEAAVGGHYIPTWRRRRR